MKNRFYLKSFLLLIVVILFQEIKAQEYTPFPTDSAVWFVEHYIKFERNEIKYIMKGDTVINDKNYSRLYQGSRFLGGIREEDKKVYFFGKYDGPCLFIRDPIEVLLYDFNLTIGDFLPDAVWCLFPDSTCLRLLKNMEAPTDGYCGGKRIIDIDSIFISGRYRKRYILEFVDIYSDGTVSTYQLGESIIEGVGSDHFLFFPFEGNEFEHWWQLDCFQDSVVDFNNVCPTVSLYKIPVSNIIEISPNPISNISYLLTNKSVGLRKLSIFDIYGRKIHDINIENIEKIPLYRNYFPCTGVYLINIETKDKSRIVRKVIVN